MEKNKRGGERDAVGEEIQRSALSRASRESGIFLQIFFLRQNVGEIILSPFYFHSGGHLKSKWGGVGGWGWAGKKGVNSFTSI